MTKEQDKASENPYEASFVERAQHDPGRKRTKVRTLASSLGLVAVIFLASGVAFGATCSLGAVIGLEVSRVAGAVNEGAMGYGLMTGLTVGSICGIVVALLLFVKLFRG